MNESIVTFNDKFEAARNTVLHAKSTQVELKYLDAASAKTKVYEDDADSYAIANARRRGDVTLSPSVTNAFFRQQILLGMEPLDINVEIAAAAAVPEIVEAVKQSARTKLEKLTEEYDPVIAKYPTSVRNQFSSGMSKHGIPHTVFLDKPVADTQDSGGKKYSKHVVNDPKTHMAWFNLYDSEDAVVMHELRKPEVICWYRNPVGKTTGQSLRIPYRLGDDRKVLHPDFIFFEKVGDREMPAIVDPHGLHLADTMPKLKGIARYVEDFGESFSRYWFVSDYKGQATYLDMKDAETDLMRGLLGDYRIIMSSEQNNSGKPLDENGMKKVAESAVSSTITFVNGIKKRADYHFGEYIENHYLNTFVDLVKKDQSVSSLLIEELALLAESMINITSLRRKVSFFRIFQCLVDPVNNGTGF